MKEKLLIVGAGGFGRVTLEHALMQFDCDFVDDGYAVGTVICGVSVVGGRKDLLVLFKDYKKLIVAIGNNRVRELIYNDAKTIGYEFPNIISASVYISPFASVGLGCVFLNNVVIQNGSKVGNGVLLNPGVEIHHDSSIEDFSLVYTNSVVRTFAKVGKRVTIGSNVSIGNNVNVDDDSNIKNGESL